MRKLIGIAVLGVLSLLSASKTPAARQTIKVVMEEQPNGDYRLYVFGGRSLVCEEKDVTVLRQPDAVEPLVVECSHAR